MSGRASNIGGWSYLRVDSLHAADEVAVGQRWGLRRVVAAFGAKQLFRGGDAGAWAILLAAAAAAAVAAAAAERVSPQSIRGGSCRHVGE